MSRSRPNMWYAWWSNKAAEKMQSQSLNDCTTEDGREFQATHISTTDDPGLMSMGFPEHDDIVCLGEVYVKDSDKKQNFQVKTIETNLPPDEERDF